MLTALSVYPFRCSDCKKRFLQVHTSRRRETNKLIKDPPPWVRAAIWTGLTIAIAVVVALVVAVFSTR